MSEGTTTVTYTDQSATSTTYTDQTSTIVTFKNLFDGGDNELANDRVYNEGLYNSNIFGGNDHLWGNIA